MPLPGQVMLKTLSLLLILAGLVLGPAYWIYVVYFTGQVAQTLALRASEDGAWTSPPFRLDPAMAPVGLILRAAGSFSPNLPDDQPPRDRYRAVLYQEGQAGTPIRLELGVKAVADSNPRFQERLLLLQRPQAGEYRLELIPEAAPVIRLSDVELDVRAQVQQTDNRIVASGIAAIALGALLLLM
jgi:hypothetical protein